MTSHPLFISETQLLTITNLLPKVCGYQPGGLLPYNHLIWADSKERLVEVRVIIIDNNDEGICDNNSSQDNERPEIMIGGVKVHVFSGQSSTIDCVSGSRKRGRWKPFPQLPLKVNEHNFLPKNTIGDGGSTAL